MLEGLSDDSIVYCASDVEGNEFHELSENMDFSVFTGAVILYPLRKAVNVEYKTCLPCECNQIFIDGECAVCGQGKPIKYAVLGGHNGEPLRQYTL